jgi:hypothetical protein
MTVAVELADYLLHEPDGVPKLKHMIVDDLAAARAAGNAARVAELESILRHFVQTHPSAGGPTAPKDCSSVAEAGCEAGGSTGASPASTSPPVCAATGSTPTRRHRTTRAGRV